MRIEISNSDFRPIYLQIAEEIRRAMLLKVVRPGDPLPSVRDLARRLPVNINTVKQAYRTLESAGLIVTRRGIGTFALSHDSVRLSRESLTRAVAERALTDAARFQVSADDLVAAIHDLKPAGSRRG